MNTGLLYRKKSTLYNAICCRVEAEPAQLQSPVNQQPMTLIRATSDRVTLKAMIFKAGVATEAKACSRDTSSSTGACGRSTQPSCPSQAQSSLHSMCYDHLHILNMFTMFFLPTVLQLHCTRCDSWQSEPHIGLCLTLLRCSLYALVAIAPISLWISVIFLHGFCSTSSRVIALFLIVLSAVVCLTHLTWSHQAQFLWYTFY